MLGGQSCSAKRRVGDSGGRNDHAVEKVEQLGGRPLDSNTPTWSVELDRTRILKQHGSFDMITHMSGNI